MGATASPQASVLAQNIPQCEAAAWPPPAPTSLPLTEAVRVSYGQAAAAATEAWPAALEFPPTNNFYKPPAS